MAQRSCCVPGCSMKLGGGLPLHRFPNPNNPAETERFRTWVMKIGGDIVGEDNGFIHRNRKVCHKHFEDIYIFPNMKLTALAIPTLEISGGHVGKHRHIELPSTSIQMATASSTRPVHIDIDLSSRPDDGTMQDDTTAMPMPFHVQVESQDVQENIETTPDAPIELMQDESSQLDPELLSALGDATDEQPIYGENIHHTLAQCWIPLLKKGLSKDLKEKILKEYQIPENCKLLKAPTLNPEIKAAVPERIINRDNNIQLKQDQLGLGISVINKAITLLLLGGDKIQAIKILSDSCRILTDLHYTETQIRTKLITPSLDKSFTPLIKDHERDETLFGEKLSETIKASKAIERQGSLIKKSAQRATSLPALTAETSTARTRFSGNGTGALRYASVSRGGRGGHPRAATAYRRTATTMRPRVSPSQGKHLAHTRH